MKKILEWFRSAPAPGAALFPDEWASFLWDQSAHYRRLSGRMQMAFRQDVQRFLATQTITGVKTSVDDPLRLLVAASAVTLSVGWPGYKWSEVSEVLLYPDSFDRDYAIGQPELAGIAHVWGTVILSVPSLRHSFTHDQERYHLGFHEFAHLLTFERGVATKIPIGLSPERMQQWQQIEAHELRRLEGGNEAPGQNPAPITVSGSQAIPESEIKNGTTPFDVQTVPPVTIIPGAPDCPNTNWTEKITDLSFTSAVITVEQPVGNLVLTVSCTFAPATSNGAVPRSSVTCVKS